MLTGATKNSLTLPDIVVTLGGRASIFHEKLRQFYTFGGTPACLAESKKGQETHLAALTGTDTIVVPWGLVLAHKAGLVDAGRRGRRRRAWHYLFRAGTLGFYGCGEERAMRMSQMEDWRKCSIIQQHKPKTHTFRSQRGDLVLLVFRVATAKSPESIYGEHFLEHASTCTTHVFPCLCR